MVVDCIAFYWVHSVWFALKCTQIDGLLFGPRWLSNLIYILKWCRLKIILICKLFLSYQQSKLFFNTWQDEIHVENLPVTKHECKYATPPREMLRNMPRPSFSLSPKGTTLQWITQNEEMHKPSVLTFLVKSSVVCLSKIWNIHLNKGTPLFVFMLMSFRAIGDAPVQSRFTHWSHVHTCEASESNAVWMAGNNCWCNRCTQK